MNILLTIQGQVSQRWEEEAILLSKRQQDESGGWVVGGACAAVWWRLDLKQSHFNGLIEQYE